MLKEFSIVLIFILLSIIFIFISLLIAKILRPKRYTPEKIKTYECGEEPEGDAWIQYNFRFYIYAILFLIFDVEVVFLFPWAVVFKKLRWVAFLDVLIFVLVILIAYIYLWAKGDLEWFKKVNGDINGNN